MAQETHANIRQWVAANVSQKVADAVQIQYGGSMNGGNAKALLAENDIDGGLIGGDHSSWSFSTSSTGPEHRSRHKKVVAVLYIYDNTMRDQTKKCYVTNQVTTLQSQSVFDPRQGLRAEVFVLQTCSDVTKGFGAK